MNAPEHDSTTIHGFDRANYVATDNLPRDIEQSHRLHEPTTIRSSIDPITAHDIGDREGKPYLVDGNVTMYFQSEETRQAYLDTPVDHPFPLIDNPYEDGEAEG